MIENYSALQATATPETGGHKTKLSSQKREPNTSTSYVTKAAAKQQTHTTQSDFFAAEKCVFSSLPSVRLNQFSISFRQVYKNRDATFERHIVVIPMGLNEEISWWKKKGKGKRSRRELAIVWLGQSFNWLGSPGKSALLRLCVISLKHLNQDL